VAAVETVKETLASSACASGAAGRRRGFVWADAVVGLAVISTVTVALLATAGRQNWESNKLADSRAADRLAESALMELQAGRALPPTEDDARVEVRHVGGGAPQGWVWAQVTATVGGRSRSVFGLAPAAPAARPVNPPTTREVRP